MATFEITGPDGGRYQVTAPDSATNDQVMQYVQSQVQPQPKQASPATNTAASEAGPLDAAMIGAGKTVSRIGQGLQQLYYGATGNQSAADALKAKVAEENRLYAPLAQAHPLATGIGESLPTMAIPVGAAAGPLAAVGRAALTNAIPGALEYGSATDRLTNAGVGALAGAAGAAGAYGLGRIINPVRGANPLATDETRALADAADITLSPAQATGSKVLSSLDATLAQYPGSAGVMAKLQQRQREGFNRAATSLLGETQSNISNDAAQLAKQGIGGRIEQAAAGVQIPTESVLNDLAAVESKYTKNLTPDQRPIVKQYMDDILSHGPTFSGEEYQTWRARIGARAASTQDSELKGALKGIQGALDKAFDNFAGPDAAKAMQTARGQYRNFKTLEPLIEKASMSSSNIPPAQVMNRALASKNMTPQMQNLAQLGQAIGYEFPNSGTAPRLLWQAILSDPLRLLNPMMSIGGPTAWVLAHAIHSPPGRAYLTNGLISPALEGNAMKYSGLLGLAAANALQQ